MPLTIKTSMKRLMLAAIGLSLSAAAVAVPPAPQDELKTVTEQVRGMIKQHHAEYAADKGKFYAAMNQVLVPHFDVPYIAKYVLGLNYRAASADQRTRFANTFKDMLLRSYADALLDNYDSLKVEWQTPRMAEGATDALVNSNITQGNGQHTNIGFRVHVIDDDWKVWDIIVENISLATNFKTQINAEIKKTSLDDVISRMEKGESVTPPKTAPGAK
ncbi:MAG: transporter substrate-binding protein [Nevskia sp.]|nr:transporter substrate-binding protein [Nevskia sp.]